MLNASIDGDDLVYHDDVNLGIAVALEDGPDRAGDPAGAAPQPRGHRRGDRRPVRRAPATKQLTPEDVQGGTFTITNPGQFGTVLATPIINQPQVAILDLEAVVKRAGRGRGPRRRLDRDPARWSTCACRSTTAPWTARKRPGSWVP